MTWSSQPLEAIVHVSISAKHLAVAAGFAVVIAGCDDDPVPEPTPESTFEPTTATPEPDPVQEDIIVETEAPLVALGEYEGSWDPATRQFEIRPVPRDEWSVVDSIELPDGTLREVRQPLWCELDVNRVNGIEINTVDGSIGITPSECGFDDFAYPYVETGMICATTSVVSRYPSTVENVYAQITYVSATGYEGYRYYDPTCCGTGANPALAPDGPGKPTDLLGLWSYGSIPSGDEVRRLWAFKNAGGYFTFRGIVVGTFIDVCDSQDNDCDGRVDEGNGCYPDGQPCIDGIDCQSGVCSDGRCGLATVEGSRFMQIGGGGDMNSAGHTVRVRVGAPSPMGDTTATGGGSSVRLGPPVE